MELKDRVAMITGANSGIGLQVTEHFLKLGIVVIALDKAVDNLKGHPERLHVLEVDLTKEEEVTRAFQWSEDNLGGIDILINNAGVGGSISLLDGNVSEWRKLFEVNVLALTQCAVEAVNSMRKRGVETGTIINITSTLAHRVHPSAPFHFYSATKHAARAITEGLRKEVRNLNVPIRICSISPGLVKTGIMKSLGDEMDKYIYDKFPSINPTDIASAIEYIIRCPQNVNICDILIQHVSCAD